MKKELKKKIHDTLFELLLGSERPVTEQMIGDLLGISRTPVRQELKNLENEGLIGQKRKKGIYLKPISVEEFSQLYDVRSVIEGFAGRLACTIIKKQDIAELNKLVKKFNDEIKTGDRKALDRIDLEFHRKLVSLSANIHLQKIMDDFAILERGFMHENDILTVNREYPKSDDDMTGHISHERIVEAVKEGNGDQCEKIIRLHIQYSKKRMMETMMNIRINPFE